VATQTIRNSGAITLGRRPGLVTLVAAVPLLVLVLLVDGLVPGMVTDAPWGHLTLGAIQCVHDLGLRAVTSRCGDVGQPSASRSSATGRWSTSGRS
jgi:hypothetical protein